MGHSSDSELIIGQDGSIYHLGLRPEQISDLVITVGDPNRVSRISKHFDHLEVQVAKREFVTHTGRIGNRRLTVLSTGIGPDNIDIAVNELDALANYDFATLQPKSQHQKLIIVRLGTSGSIQEDVDPGTLLLSRFGLGLDNMMRYYSYENTPYEQALSAALDNFLAEQAIDLPVAPYLFEGAERLATALGKGIEQVITLTSPGFYGPQGRQLRAPVRVGAAVLDKLRHFTFDGFRISNFEMETSAIFGLSRLLGHEAISCNVILGNRIKRTFAPDAYASIDRMIELQLERIIAL